MLKNDLLISKCCYEHKHYHYLYNQFQFIIIKITKYKSVIVSPNDWTFFTLFSCLLIDTSTAKEQILLYTQFWSVDHFYISALSMLIFSTATNILLFYGQSHFANILKDRCKKYTGQFFIKKTAIREATWDYEFDPVCLPFLSLLFYWEVLVDWRTFTTRIEYDTPMNQYSILTMTSPRLVINEYHVRHN